MRKQFLLFVIWPVLALATRACAQQDSCANLMNLKVSAVEITMAKPIAAGSTEQISFGPSVSLPAYCRVEGIINRRLGVGGQEFGIRFALAMPDKWNSDFLNARPRWCKWNCAAPAR
jgi:hypothetical protein